MYIYIQKKDTDTDIYKSPFLFPKTCSPKRVRTWHRMAKVCERWDSSLKFVSRSPCR